MNHSEWKTRGTRKLLGEQVEESSAYVEAGYAFALAQAVHDPVRRSVCRSPSWRGGQV